MANKTYYCAEWRFETPNDKIEAQKVLKRTYPDIIYIPETDSYNYRGYEFDYFKSGISINGGENGYLLVDKDNHKIWLFTYGNLEDRWNDYLKYKKPKTLEKMQVGFLSRIYYSILNFIKAQYKQL